MRAMSLVLALVLIPLPQSAGADEARQVRITSAVANVRSAPAATAKVMFQLRAGDVVRLTETTDQWYGIETPDGRKGYVFHRLGEVIEPPAPVPPPAPAAPPPASTPGASASTLGIQHDQIGCAVAGLYPKIDACLVPAESVGKAEIHFRATDTDPWYGVALASDGPCQSAFLPKPQRTTAEFQYYVDAVDRSFGEHLKPEGGPAAPYHVRVVKNDRECGTLGRLAYSAGKVVKPILVGIVRDPAGRALATGAAEMMAAHALLAGFAQEGVILASSAAASGTAAGTAAASGGGAGAGGGIGATTLAIVGGAVVAAAVVVKAASGGGTVGAGGGSGGSGSGGAPTTTMPAPLTATGHWVGTFTYASGGSGDRGTCDLVLSQSGSAVTGVLSLVSTVGGPNDSGSAPITGTAANGQISFMFAGGNISCSAFQGPFDATTMTLTAQCGGFTTMLSLIRQ